MNTPTPISSYIVDFYADTISGTTPLLVHFSNFTTLCPISASPVPPPQITKASISPTLTWQWNFGDGTYSNQFAPSHSYFNTQSYTVQLQAITSNGQTYSKIKTNYIRGIKTSTNLPVAIRTSVLNKIAYKTPTTSAMDLYSVTDDESHTYTRNSNLWCSNINWSCIPVYGSNFGTKYGGVLITPDILLQAYHIHEYGTVYFVDANNNTFSSSIIEGIHIPSSLDIYISKLSTPLPPTIIPAKILPPSAYTNAAMVNILRTYITNQTIPSVYSNQLRRMPIGLISELVNYTFVNKDTTNPLKDWYIPSVNGDSGAPAFLIIDESPVILGVCNGSNFMSQTANESISQYIQPINTVISNLGSTYPLTYINLSKYLTYPYSNK